MLKKIIFVNILVLCLITIPEFSHSGEKIILELKDGSVVKGELLKNNDSDNKFKIKTSFGDVSIEENLINNFYIKKKLSKSKPAQKVKKPKNQRIQDKKEPSMEKTDPEKLLSMDDESLLKLLEKSGKPVVDKTENKKDEIKKEAVEDLYTFDDEKELLLPPKITEIKELDKKPNPELNKIDEKIKNIVSNDKDKKEKKKDPEKKIKKKEVKKKKVEEDKPPEYEEYIPEKGTVDSKIYKQIKKHGGLPVTQEEFKKLKRDEIEKLLERHKLEDDEEEDN